MTSALERTFDTLLIQLAPDLPTPFTEYVFAAPRKWRFDFAWPENRVAVELEGGVWSGGRHTRPQGFEDDAEKYNRASELGWRVLRFTSKALESDPENCIEQLRAALAPSEITSTATTNSLNIGCFEFSEREMVVNGNPTFDEWQAVGLTLRYVEKNVQWWIGDWLSWGEWKWGDKYTQAVQLTGRAEQTVMNYQWVANEFSDPSRRRENLTFSHHAAVAGLPTKEEQDRFLDEAESQDMSVGELSGRVQAAKRKSKNIRSFTVYAGDVDKTVDILRRELPANELRAVVQRLIELGALASE